MEVCVCLRGPRFLRGGGGEPADEVDVSGGDGLEGSWWCGGFEADFAAGGDDGGGLLAAFGCRVDGVTDAAADADSVVGFEGGDGLLEFVLGCVEGWCVAEDLDGVTHGFGYLGLDVFGVREVEPLFVDVGFG